MNEALHTFRNDDAGIEIRVFRGERGFNVTLFDLDAELYFPSSRMFPTEAAAVEYAAKVADGSATGASITL